MVCLFYLSYIFILFTVTQCWMLGNYIGYVDLGQRRVPSWSCDQKIRWHGNLGEKYVNTDKTRNKQSWQSSLEATSEPENGGGDASRTTYISPDEQPVPYSGAIDIGEYMNLCAVFCLLGRRASTELVGVVSVRPPPSACCIVCLGVYQMCLPH